MTSVGANYGSKIILSISKTRASAGCSEQSLTPRQGRYGNLRTLYHSITPDNT